MTIYNRENIKNQLFLLMIMIFSIGICFNTQAFASSVPKAIKNIKYMNGNKYTKLDFYPGVDTEGLNPLIIYFHGGGFTSGKRTSIKLDVKKLQQKGVSVMSCSYPLQKTNGANNKDRVNSKNDIYPFTDKAIEFILKNTEKYNIDRYRIVVSGSSAGCELALRLVYLKKYGFHGCYAINIHGGLRPDGFEKKKINHTDILIYNEYDKSKDLWGYYLHHPERSIDFHNFAIDRGIRSELYGLGKYGLSKFPHGTNNTTYAIEYFGLNY